MSLHAPTIAFLRYLETHPTVCKQIRAAAGKTMLYAGDGGPTLGTERFGYLVPMWREIARLKSQDPQYHDKEVLHDVIERVAAPDTPFNSVLLYVQDVEQKLGELRRITNAVIDGDTDAIWRAMSAIFAKNAEGPVSICIGRAVNARKIFASTELPILLQNQKVDRATHDILHFYDRCFRSGQTDVGLSIIRK